jgi:hypothetical protein
MASNDGTKNAGFQFGSQGKTPAGGTPKTLSGAPGGGKVKRIQAGTMKGK